MSGRGNSPGLFGIVGGLLWGAPRNISPSDELEEEVAILEDSKKSPQAHALPSSDLGNHEDNVDDDIIEPEGSVDMRVGSDNDDNESGTEDSASSGGSDNDDDVDALTYEGELITEMSYRTMQIHLKAMGIKCTGKKAQLQKSLQAAVQSGSADRLRSLRHASPMHPYPHENARTPKRKRLSSPTANSQTQSPPASARSTRLRSEKGRRTRNSTGLVVGSDSVGGGGSRVKSKRRSARTSEVDGSDRPTPSVAAPVAAKSTQSKTATSSGQSSKKKQHRTQTESAMSTLKGDASPPKTSPTMSPVRPPQSQTEKNVTNPAVGADSDSEPYFSSEECSPGQLAALTPLTNGSTVQLAVVGNRMPSSVGTTDDMAILSTASTGGGSSIKGEEGEDVNAEDGSVVDSVSALDAVSVAATVGSIAEDDRSTIDLGDLPPPQPFPQEGKFSVRASYSSLGYDDDRSSVVSFADQPLRPSRRSDLSVLSSGGLTPPVRNALDAIGHRFIEMLKGEGPEMTEAEFAIYQSVLESKRKGMVSAADAGSSLSTATPSAALHIQHPATSAPTRATEPQTTPFQLGEAMSETEESDKDVLNASVSRSSASDPFGTGREERKVQDSRQTGSLREDSEQSFGSASQRRKRTVADAELSSADWGRASTSSAAGSLQEEEDDEYSQQGKRKRQYRGDPFEPPPPVGYMDTWPAPSHRGSAEGRGVISMSSSASSYPEQYSPREYQESNGPSQWQQDREWMAPRRHSFIPTQPQQYQPQQSPRYSTHSVQASHTPRFQESGNRFSESGFRGYGQSASSGMAPISLQVQQHKSLTPGMSSVQRRLMKRRVAGASTSGSDGSYSGSYGASRAASATASGAVAKRILDTLGDITSSLDEQRRKPLPTSAGSTLAMRDSADSSTEVVKTSVRFSESASDRQHDRKVGFAATPSSSNSTSNSLKYRKGTPHGAAVNAACSAASSTSLGNDDDAGEYDDRRSSTSSDQLWSRDTGRGPSMSPPVPPGKPGREKTAEGSTSFTSRKDTDDSENEFMFDSPTRLEGIDGDDVVAKKSSVRFAFSPPGKKKGSKQQIGKPLTPGVALKAKKPTAVTAGVPKMSTMSTARSDNASDSNEDSAAPKKTGFSESIWKRPNTVQCKVCLVYNDEKAEKCVSCESKMGTTADTSCRTSAAAASTTSSASADGGKSTFEGFGGAPKAISAAASKSAIGSGGFSFGAKPATNDSTTALDAPKKPSVTFGAPSSTGAGFKFGSTTAVKATDEESVAAEKNTDVSSTTTAASAKPSFGVARSGGSEITASTPVVSISSDKKFSGFGFSSTAKEKSGAAPATTTGNSDAVKEDPSAKETTPAISSFGAHDSSNVVPASAPKPTFGFTGSKPQTSESAPTPPMASFGLKGAATPSVPSGLDFTKKITTPASSGFSFGNKRTSDGPSSDSGSRGGVDDEDEGRGRKRANVNTDDAPTSTPAASTGLSFGKTAPTFGSSTATSALSSTPSTSTGASKPSFGFLTSTSKAGSSTDTRETSGEAPKPSSGFAFKVSAPTPAADKASSTSFQFGSTGSADKPTGSTSISGGVKGPFGASPSIPPTLGSSSSTSTKVSGPFGGSGAAADAPKPAVTGVFGSGSSTGGSSSFKFSPAGTGAASTGVSFKFGEKKAPPTAPVANAATTNFKSFGGFSAAASTPSKDAAPPPPYGSESPGSGMDTGYASGDASNMSTGALPPVANQPTTFSSSSFGSFGGVGAGGGGGSGFGSTQSSLGSGAASTFGGSTSFGGGSTGFSMGATAKPASFGGSAQNSSSFSFKPSAGGGSSFGSGGAGGGIAFSQGQSSYSQQSGTAAPPSGGFSLGSIDKKQQAGRRKLKAKKFN